MVFLRVLFACLGLLLSLDHSHQTCSLAALMLCSPSGLVACLACLVARVSPVPCERVSLVSLAAKASCGCGVFGCVGFCWCFGFCLVWSGFSVLPLLL